MAGLRRGARTTMKWFSALYVVLIIVQVFLAGEGIFGLNNIKHSDDCKHHPALCVGGSGSLDPHRALGFFSRLERTVCANPSDTWDPSLGTA